ncbi:MAG: tRNA uridine-5-carboxymethylaminomethyl(34) synthesis enzyme MnmG [Oscillospiraceae bacterium]|nr:tRNA uridine-5-carboxymethylaminomethyl(34) synthesis enzyme MnmG [Oscillospiraceae bacterium]
MDYFAGEVDVAVIGAGHAGIEAALAAARSGCRAAVFTMNADWVGNMPCNPSIGGSSKGHLVREIDALGGVMGQIADRCALQSRMLGRGKGPAVHSPRAQVDRRAYAAAMKFLLESQENLALRQAEIVEISHGDTWTITTRLGAQYRASCVILATGTFLAGKVHIGDAHWASGPDGMFPATALAGALRTLGLPLRRFKTGTPPRINRRSVDFSVLEIQEGETPPVRFSFGTSEPEPRPELPCHICYTTAETARVIRENLHRSPLFSGQIEGTGPRYCPSIEDKIVRFPDKERHQLFLEPCGENTQELYLQGLSSSLPEDVQLAILRTIPGLEHALVTRPAYAIEYDCVDPLAMGASLEFRDWPGLFGAGQFNGSSGYEEAAAQGLLAGINAARRVQGQDAVILPRSGSYIGTLIDDLVTKGCTAPYRMMTARSEYRLLLRQDNADRRLMPIGHKIGLIDDARIAMLREKCAQIDAEKQRAEKTRLRWDGISATVAELLRRPHVHYAHFAAEDIDRPALSAEVLEAVEIDLKYAGYLARQAAQVREAARLESQPLPTDLDYEALTGLRLEAREKLAAARPENLGQAGRISGVTPADINVLMIWLQKLGRAT